MAAALEEARDELQAWRAQDASERRVAVDLERYDRWRVALKARGSAVLVLQAMVRGAGKVVSKDAVVAASRGAPGVWADRDELNPKYEGVLIHFARQALLKAGLQATIRTVRGCGYTINQADADRVLQAVGEA